MLFIIRAVEAAKNRIHKSGECLKEWDTYDNSFFKHAIRTTKCKPYYWAKYMKGVDFCKTLEENNRIREHLDTGIAHRSKFPKPCGFLERFTFDYQELNLKPSSTHQQNSSSNSKNSKVVSLFTGNAEFISNDVIWVTVFFMEPTYKLIKQVNISKYKKILFWISHKIL